MAATITPPADGSKITFAEGELDVPDNPIIPYIEGDGIGADLWVAAHRVFNGAVEKVYGGARKIHWMEIPAGEKANEETGEYLPQVTLDAIQEYKVSIKGPLTTPVGGGIRSLNVSMRQLLDLYACVRPVKYYKGTPSPVKAPEKMDIVIYRENTEDVYAGIEWAEGTDEAKKVIEFLTTEMGAKIRPDSGIGIKPMSITGTKNLVRKAIQYATDNDRDSVTLVHKGNIMKYTEGAFREWGYELAVEEFGDVTITEDEIWGKARRQGSRGQAPDQGPHRRRHVPAGADPPRRVRRGRDAQPQRGLHVGCYSGSGRRPGHRAGRQHRRLGGAVRADPWFSAQVHGAG